MKLRWHILFIALGVLAAILFAYTPRQPLWLLIDAGRMVRYAGCDPVRREWYCLSSTTEKTDWELETRVGMSPEVVRRVKLALPKLNGETQSLFISSDQPNKPWIVWDSRQSTSDARLLPKKTFLWLINPLTGELLKHSPLQNTSFGNTIVSHGNKIAMMESGWIKLFDCQTLRERDFHVNYLQGVIPSEMLGFSSDGSLLVCLDSTRQSLIMIDWESTTCSQQSLGFQVASFNFISTDVLLIHDGKNASRWKWNGKEFVRISPGVAVASNVIPVQYRKHPSGLLQFLASFGAEWPIPIHSWFEWLESKGIPVSKWYPKTKQGRWYLVDEQDRILSEFHEPLFDTRIKVYDHYAVEIHQYAFDIQTKKYPGRSIYFWSIAPIWPNALALGMMVYLMLYVATRCISKS